jgi:hypothetical protein
MRSLQSYLTTIDPLLFIILKTIRRCFELQPSLQWVISDKIAAYLYAYSAGLAPINVGTPSLELKVKATSVEDIDKLESVIRELQRHGFVRADKDEKIEITYPLCSILIHISIVDNVQINWMTNKKGKHTYPLTKIENVKGEKDVWWKEVVNHVIIE